MLGLEDCAVISLHTYKIKKYYSHSQDSLLLLLLNIFPSHQCCLYIMLKKHLEPHLPSFLMAFVWDSWAWPCSESRGCCRRLMIGCGDARAGERERGEWRGETRGETRGEGLKRVMGG